MATRAKMAKTVTLFIVMTSEAGCSEAHIHVYIHTCVRQGPTFLKTDLFTDDWLLTQARMLISFVKESFLIT